MYQPQILVRKWHHQRMLAPRCIAGPYNKIQNWDYVKLIESMDNGNDQSWAVRVSSLASMTPLQVLLMRRHASIGSLGCPGADTVLLGPA